MFDSPKAQNAHLHASSCATTRPSTLFLDRSQIPATTGNKRLMTKLMQHEYSAMIEIWREYIIILVKFDIVLELRRLWRFRFLRELELMALALGLRGAN